MISPCLRGTLDVDSAPHISTVGLLLSRRNHLGSDLMNRVLVERRGLKFLLLLPPPCFCPFNPSDKERELGWPRMSEAESEEQDGFSLQTSLLTSSALTFVYFPTSFSSHLPSLPPFHFSLSLSCSTPYSLQLVAFSK